MQVKLKVLNGASAGKDVPIASRQFLIGRGEDCHLRPRTDSVSRRHCLLTIEDSRVLIRDLGSRNGTVVNGETITEEVALNSGDLLRVGRLEFEVAIDHGLGGAKKPKVHGVKDAASRAARTVIDDGDITDWLEEGDEVDRARKLAEPETRQFRLDETDRVALDRAAAEQETKADETEAPSSEAEANDAKAKKKKKEPGKLPRVEAPMAADTRTAAADTLRKFFNRR